MKAHMKSVVIRRRLRSEFHVTLKHLWVARSTTLIRNPKPFATTTPSLDFWGKYALDAFRSVSWTSIREKIDENAVCTPCCNAQPLMQDFVQIDYPKTTTLSGKSIGWSWSPRWHPLTEPKPQHPHQHPNIHQDSAMWRPYWRTLSLKHRSLSSPKHLAFADLGITQWSEERANRWFAYCGVKALQYVLMQDTHLQQVPGDTRKGVHQSGGTSGFLSQLMAWWEPWEHQSWYRFPRSWRFREKEVHQVPPPPRPRVRGYCYLGWGTSVWVVISVGIVVACYSDLDIVV